MYIPNIAARKLLRKYAKRKDGSKHVLGNDEFTNMMQLLREGNPELAEFILELDEGKCTSPDGCRAFLFSPVMWFTNHYSYATN